MGVCTSHEIGDGVEISHRVVSSPPKLKKRVSDMNLVPGDMNNQWYRIDESDFDAERTMLVLASPTSSDLPAKVLLIDLDRQSRTFGQKVSELTLPGNGDELLYGSWARGASSSNEVNKLVRTYLVAPCFNTSRIYVIGIDDAQQMRVSKCLELQELGLKEVSFPLDCFSCPGKGGPLFISMLGNKEGAAKGTLAKMDRKMFTMNQRLEKDRRESKYGGTFAIHPRHNLLICCEQGHPKNLHAGLQIDAENKDELYGNLLNVWEIEPRLLKQQIFLDDLDGRMPICIRFVHNPELVHAFVTTLGGAIYHLHRNSRTEAFTARKAFQFANAHVSGWLQEEVPAVPVDMVISMDDQFMYVSSWLQGFVHQFNIVDPFNLTPAHKIFLGGIIHKEFGLKLQRISTINFMPTRRRFRGIPFEGGPSRLQLSLDGRRLFIGNSWISSWDNSYYPRLQDQGSLIVLIHININSAGSMTLDENFCIQMCGDRQQNEYPYLAREMHFLNGDSTSDAFL